MSEHDDEQALPETEPDESSPLEHEPGEDEQAAEEEPEAGPDEEPDEEPVPAAPSEPQGLTPEAWEKRQKRADAAMIAYAKKIGDIFEDDAVNLIECPLCPSIHKGFLNRLDAGRVPDDVKNAAMMFLGYAVERDYPQDPTHKPCETCAASGKVRTGSTVAGKETLDCPTCKGFGYTPPPGVSANGPVPGELVVTGPTVVPTGAGVPDTDPSGEPRLLPDGRENPNYGKWPQYKISVDPWGVTAGLTVQDAVA